MNEQQAADPIDLLVAELNERTGTLKGVTKDRALRAIQIVKAALQIDPTLPEPDRHEHDLALIKEVLRQIQPLSKQAAILLEFRRLQQAAEVDQSAVAKLGRVNVLALDELDDLSRRAVNLAEAFAAAAWPDWNTPDRILERSRNLLPSEGQVENIAGRLRRAVADSLTLAYPAPEAVRLAALADQISGWTPPPDLEHDDAM